MTGGPPVRPLDRFYTRVMDANGQVVENIAGSIPPGSRVQLGPRYSVNSEFERFAPRDPAHASLFGDWGGSGPAQADEYRAARRQDFSPERAGYFRYAFSARNGRGQANRDAFTVNRDLQRVTIFAHELGNVTTWAVVSAELTLTTADGGTGTFVAGSGTDVIPSPSAAPSGSASPSASASATTPSSSTSTPSSASWESRAVARRSCMRCGWGWWCCDGDPLLSKPP